MSRPIRPRPTGAQSDPRCETLSRPPLRDRIAPARRQQRRVPPGSGSRCVSRPVRRDVRPQPQRSGAGMRPSATVPRHPRRSAVRGRADVCHPRSADAPTAAGRRTRPEAICPRGPVTFRSKHLRTQTPSRPAGRAPCSAARQPAPRPCRRPRRAFRSPDLATNTLPAKPTDQQLAPHPSLPAAPRLGRRRPLGRTGLRSPPCRPDPRPPHRPAIGSLAQRPQGTGP